jgi:hypothetical protein
MSLIGSLLSLVLIPLKAKPHKLAAERPAEDRAALALAKEVKCLQFALDHWRDSGHALWEENQRLRQELRGVRDEWDLVRAELRELMVQKDPTSLYYRHSGFEAHLNRLNATMLQTRDSPHPYCIPSRGQALNRD